MVLLLIVGLVVVAVLGVGLWFLLPSLKMVGRPDFEPTYTDEETVFQVQQKGIADAGQGGPGV
jgi:hypothetical protein